MTRTLSIKDLRPALPEVARAVEKQMARYIITRRGKPVMTILSLEDFEGLLETIDILSDRTAAARIRRSRIEAKKKMTRSLSAIRKRLERVPD